MSLLDSMHHRATIYKRTSTQGALGGTKSSFPVVQTDVECWEQQASQSETEKHKKKARRLVSKIYFPSDPGITEQNLIAITSRNDVDVSSPVMLEIGTDTMPDASAGLGWMFRVFCYLETGEDD